MDRKFCGKTYAVRFLLALTAILSVSRVGKSFGTLDTALFYPLVDAVRPEVSSVHRDSSDLPALKYLYKGDNFGPNETRKMEAAGINGSENMLINKKGEGSETRRDSHRGKELGGMVVEADPSLNEDVVFDKQGAETDAPRPIVISNRTTVEFGDATNERIAIVVRSMDPVRAIVVDRLMQIAEIFQKDEFRNYDFHIMIDQTKKKSTTTEKLQNHFRARNASHLKAPRVFSVTEKMILEEFPRLANGYVKGPLVDGGKGTCCGQPLLWQLLIPTFVTFVHYHQEYDYTWVLEDDLWSLGTNIVELLRVWDDKLRGKNASLVGSRLSMNGIPYMRMTKERHTFGFRDILISMKATGWQHRNQTLLEMDGQVRSHVWNEWGENRLPVWSCMSDTLYRHSRDFGNYVYSMVKSNVYQFAECYQMPLAWHGGFSITDIKKILPNIAENHKDGRRDEPGIHVKWENVAYNRKLELEQAEIKLQNYRKRTNVSAVIYHELFVPCNGKEFRTIREHSKLCSLAYDFRRDSILTADCEKTLRAAEMHMATGVIFLGNAPIFNIFQNFLAGKTAGSKFNILKDDGYSEQKNQEYYRFPPVNYDEWMKNKSQVANEIYGKVIGKGKCKICRQAKLKSLSKNVTMEALLVESSRDLFFPSRTTKTSQETVAKWISENYHDHPNVVCIIQMDGFEMMKAPLRTKSEFLENTKILHDLLKPTCTTIIRFGFLPHFSTRSVKDIVSWDEGLRDLVLDDRNLNGYFIDVSNAKKSDSNNRYSKPIWKMFLKLMGLSYSDFGV